MARIGEEHALVAEVNAQLDQARLDLAWARVYAPCDGLITDLQLREGQSGHSKAFSFMEIEDDAAPDHDLSLADMTREPPRR